ncbi:alcohol dehydrogenase [Rhizina undulata]
MVVQVPEIPKLQWAQVFETNGGPIEYKQIPVRMPGSDEVLVNIKFTGVCHTDLHAWKGDWPLATKSPLVGGHEGAGVVVAVGELVKDIQVGDHAGIKWLNGSCGACEFCMASDEPLCQKALLSGYTVDGSFQQYAIGKASHVARIPKEVPLDAIAPVLCAGITVYKALKESNARPGNTVVITGAGGGLGSLAVQYGRAMGFRIIGIDTGEEKKNMCLKVLGAEEFVDFATEDVVARVKELTGGVGAHAVILLAVSEKPFQQATDYCRSRGSVVCVGMPANARISAEVFSTVVRMLTIKGSYVGNRLDTQEALDFFKRGLISAPFKVGKLSELKNVYEKMEKGQIAGRYVLDTSK